MTPPDDTIPPAPSEPIAAGRAALAVALRFAAVAKAMADLEAATLAFHATSDAVARALDATVKPTEPTP